MFTLTGSMTTVQRADSATLLADGKVLVAKDDHAELYDPAAGTLALTGAYADPTPVLWIFGRSLGVTFRFGSAAFLRAARTVRRCTLYFWATP
jgi:hypothetical protein